MQRSAVLARYFDASLLELLEAFPKFVDGFDCLLTCLDSGPETSYAVMHDFPGEPIETCGKFAVISGRRLLTIKGKLFTGFDEIYVFRKDIWRELDPVLWSAHFTTERIHAEGALPRDLVSIFEKSRAVRYAADGCGLNVIVREDDLLEAITSALIM